MTVPFVQIFPVFDADSPYLARALLLASEELIFWGLSGARGMVSITSLPWGRMGVNFGPRSPTLCDKGVSV